jgi:tRNA (cmo5U34)-methyltransferase
VLNPLTMHENLSLLERSGFRRVETFFRWYNWAGFVAMKAW